MVDFSVAVTGASGFLASEIIKQLQEGVCKKAPFSFRASRVIGVDLIAPKEPVQGVQYLIGSVTDAQFMDKALKNINVVFHCCSLVDLGLRSLNELLKVNLGGTKNVTHSCEKNGVDYIIYTSSCDAVAWRTRDNTNLKEDGDQPEKLGDFRGANYGFSKSQAEKHLKSWSELNNTKVCAIRPGGLFGVDDKHFVPGVLQNLRKNAFSVFFGKASYKQSFNYVRNVAFIHLFSLHHMIQNNSTDSFFVFNAALPEEIEKLQSFHDFVVELGTMINAPREVTGDLFLPEWLILFFVIAFDKFNHLFVLRYNTVTNEQAIRSTFLPLTLNTDKLVDAGIMEFKHCLTSHKEAIALTREWVQNEFKDLKYK